MKIQVIHKGQLHEFEDAEFVLVKNNSNTPVAVASESGVPGALVVSSIDDDQRFNEVLRSLGVNITVLVQHQKLLLPEQMSYIK